MPEQTTPIAETNRFIVLDKYVRAWEAADSYQCTYPHTGSDHLLQPVFALRMNARAHDDVAIHKMLDQRRPEFAMQPVQVGFL